MRALARREHGARELQLKLVHGGTPESLAADVIAEFAQRGWQSDARYAESLARTRIAQGYGPLRIAAELEAAGITAEIAQSLVVPPDEDGWLAVARRAWQRRFHARPRTAAEWQRQWRFLAQRGFAANDIRTLLDQPPD
ncbi:MAG TPA: regulatory protein RecX [Nevskiaceae bacterium]